MSFALYTLQPKKIEEIKDFLITARRKDAKCKCVCVRERGGRKTGEGSYFFAPLIQLSR